MSPGSGEEIDPRAAIGPIALRVGDLEGVRAFYEEALGMVEVATSGGRAAGTGSTLLGAPGAAIPMLELLEAPGALPRPRGTTGLFHLAVLVPSRAELARALGRLRRAGWRLAGAADHLVSEALYLLDPEGNGIEIYRDRPREEWRRDADGELEMATLPLDLETLLAEAESDRADRSLASEAGIGHLHLNVSDLESAERFYASGLGFKVTVRAYRGALFLAAGDYHHHIGVNTWNGPGASVPPPGSLGLAGFEVRLPGEDSLRATVERLRQAGIEIEPGEESGSRAGLTDPYGIGIRLVAR